MWTFIAIAAAAFSALVVAEGLKQWRNDVKARRAFEATLSDDERKGLGGFLCVCRDWRKYVAVIEIHRKVDAAELRG